MATASRLLRFSRRAWLVNARDTSRSLAVLSGCPLSFPSACGSCSTLPFATTRPFRSARCCLSTAGTASTSKDHPTELESGDIPPKPELLEFQAETRQLLDIVTHSLYTDKEVFLRELISNASDSCEKLRHVQATAQPVLQPEIPLEIRVDLDEVTSTITITDTGIGMTADELKENLGTIAKSGSKAFVQSLQQETSTEVEAAARGIIGKFGVGFYSAFMIGAKVEVRSKSAIHQDEPAHVWASDGTGTYTIAPLEAGIRQDRGTSIIIHVKEEYWDFVDEQRIEKILKRYSNFVNFPIHINGNRVNTIQAIWTQDPKTVSEETYSAFYKYIANAIDEPLDVYHFRVDAPLDLSAVLFTPSFHSEKYGMGRMEPGVSLYSRKVLIENKSNIMPEWLRFLKGVVDSEDLPLAISREKAQDSALLSKIRRALTRKYIAHLSSMVKHDRGKYIDEFYKEYSFFLKEGICQDYEFQAGLSKLMYFETNKSSDLKSLDEYISSMRPEQKDIYYLVAPTRDAALQSPYLEAFEKAGIEVLVLFTAIDDFVMANLEQYEGRKLVSVEKSDIDLSELTPQEEKNLYESERKLSAEQCMEFCTWFRKEIGESKVASCVVTSRLSSSPAIVVDNESGAMRRMMRMVDTSDGSRDGIPLPKQHVEINPNHSVIVGIYDLLHKEPTLARVLAEQVFDNCLIAAGLLDDSRSMLPRLNDILLCTINGAKAQQDLASTSSTNKPAESMKQEPTVSAKEDPVSTGTAESAQEKSESNKQ